ncbi:MAG: tripartite tricarboxylate transporter TctB family protein, partial [Lachnospiraceae bacterium]|nr:tripartite tricarboxylate transporter TctB family protein [Lachnospiraceae bacterium]
WETGSNMPDISLLVQIADFYDVDVREIIEGERKSEIMDEEVRDVANKMADYATAEKSKLLRTVQCISFAGLILLMLSIGYKVLNLEYDENLGWWSFGSIFFSVVLLVIMSVITLYVTGALEKIVKHRVLTTIIKVVTIGGLAIGGLYVFMVPIILIGFLVAGPLFARPEVHTDIENYGDYMSWSMEKTDDVKWNKCGMDETIWPREITEDMDIEDYKMIYYNPWDPQYLGYLVVEYSDADYAKEVQRLQTYDSTDYIGYYSVKKEMTHDLLAVNADEYYGFIYALDLGDNRIVYAEQIFCNYFMDLKYEKYMPKDYFLDGFDATGDNPYREQIHAEQEAIDENLRRIHEEREAAGLIESD